MSLPLYDNGWLWALVLGVLMGVALEGAGFGSPRKLVAQFTLRDWSVFKVMFAAVVIAGIGLWLLEAFGAMGRADFYVPTLYAWAVPIGGALIGAGFAIGGYCPGTSVAGLASGRLDALVFMLGMVAGVWLFAGSFDVLEGIYRAGEGPARQTLDELAGVPAWVVLAALAALAVGGFLIARRVEAARGGPYRADDIAAGK